MANTLSLPGRAPTAVRTTVPVIALNGIGMTYGTGRVEMHALREVNLEIIRGEYVAVTGPSGAGKSTLLSILGLIDLPTSGTYQLAGEPTAKLSRSARAKTRNSQIGFVFQSFNLIDELSALDNVAMPLTYRGGLSAGECRNRAMKALETLGLSDRADSLPAELSGGQQQRVAIARAIVGEPQIIIADEPTGNLDSNTSRQIRRLLSALHVGGMTVVLATHDESHIHDATRVVRLIDGCVIEDSRELRVPAVVA